MFTGAHKAILNTEYRLMMSAFYDVQSELEEAIQSLTDSGCENIILHALDVKGSYLIELAEKISGLVIIGRFLPVLQNRCVWMDG
jgi:LacI family transcriptional regulator